VRKLIIADRIAQLISRAPRRARAPLAIIAEFVRKPQACRYRVRTRGDKARLHVQPSGRKINDEEIRETQTHGATQRVPRLTRRPSSRASFLQFDKKGARAA